MQEISRRTLLSASALTAALGANDKITLRLLLAGVLAG